MTGQDGAAGVIADLVRTHSGAGLPVRLRLWDGSEVGPAGAPVLIARSPRALRRLLWRPGELGLQPGSRLLDMGCGWGSLTVHAARDHRAQVTAVTLSAEQGGYVRQRVRGLGLAGRAEVRIQDYRDPVDQAGYDAIASVEMGEHVGAAQYPRFRRPQQARRNPHPWSFHN